MMRQWFAALLVLTTSVLHGQQSAPADSAREPAFEVASVKPNTSGSSRGGLAPQPGGRFTATNVTLMDLIRVAYGTDRPFLAANVLGAPGWASRDRFDIAARAAGNPTQAEFLRMLRPLLADRFQLRAHLENQERPIYTLTLARRNGQLGPGLRRSALNCAGAAGPNSVPASECEMLTVPGLLKARGAAIGALLRALSSSVDDHREVRDETRLTGVFDMDLHWTPTIAPAAPADARPDTAAAIAAVDPNGPSLFTALQEQMGLRLVPGKDQATVLIIDHVAPPTPD